MGALTTLDLPPFSCACAFDVRVTPAGDPPPPGCTPCAGNGDCTDPARPSCSFGYCEASP